MFLDLYLDQEVLHLTCDNNCGSMMKYCLRYSFDHDGMITKESLFERYSNTRSKVAYHW